MNKKELKKVADNFAMEREQEQLEYPVEDYSADKVILYHGTNTDNLDKILQDGLCPRGNNKGNWEHTIRSRNDMVYLTNSYAVYFAMCSIPEDSKASPVVLEVEVDTKSLYPDEDFLEQATRTNEMWQDYFMSMSIGQEDITARTEYFRDNISEFQDDYTNSLKYLGNACYLGEIKPESIKRYSVLDDSKVWEHSDPTITLMNYKILGSKYRKLSKKTMWEEPLSINQVIFNKE
jgi:hypothetical protein